MKTVLRYPIKTEMTSGCRLATGRSCIMHMANRWQPDHVFMPCFVPEGVFHPFVALGVKVVFYKLTEALDIDLQDLKEKMEANEGKRPVVVAIHYFGTDEMTDGVAALAHKHGGIMLADCAQAIMGAAKTDADVVLYSINKFLPVADGAIIGSRKADLDLSIDHSSLPQFPQFAADFYREHLRANAAIAAASVGEDVSEHLAVSERAYDLYYDFIDNNMEPMAQSNESRTAEAMADLLMMVAMRNMRAMLLSGRLSENLVLQELQSPQFAFPIRCLGQRERMVQALTSIGVLPSALVDRWDHIPTAGGFDVERQFIDDHLLIPINEDMEFQTLNRVVRVLNAFAWGAECQTISLH